MKNHLFCFSVLVFVSLFVIQGCAAASQITTKKGSVSIGMTKAEVRAIWGEPKQKSFLDEPDRLGRYELWDYGRLTWWGAHTIELSFNKEGVLIEIEPLYK